MLKRIREMLRDRRGFTLIELMVVVVIIGILAAIAVPQFMGQSEKAKKSKAIADLKMIGSSVELYYTENGRVPDKLEELTGENGYLRSYPYDPWKNEYHYSKTTYKNGNIYVPFTLYFNDATNNNQPVYYPPTTQ